MKARLLFLLAALLVLRDPPMVAANTIFDNTTGLFNGGANFSTNRWLAGVSVFGAAG